MLLIKTDRLVLKEIQIDDTDQIVQWRSNPSVFCYFKNPHAITANEHINWFLRDYLSNENRRDFIGNLAGKPIGVFGIQRELSESKEAEISYLLDPVFSGCGFAQESIIAILAWAKETWGISEAFAMIHQDNQNSVHFIERMEFTRAYDGSPFIRYWKKL